MKKNFLFNRYLLVLVCFVAGLILNSANAQKGLTLEQALTVAEDNSPTVIKMRLNLERKSGEPQRTECCA